MSLGDRIARRGGGSAGVVAWVASDASLSTDERLKLALFASRHPRCRDREPAAVSFGGAPDAVRPVVGEEPPRPAGAAAQGDRGADRALAADHEPASVAGASPREPRRKPLPEHLCRARSCGTSPPAAPVPAAPCMRSARTSARFSTTSRRSSG